jgi:predicted unusual protein kinase regulating ubiquinone biosynthesis (AarF/ABC1/UbiB family)
MPNGRIGLIDYGQIKSLKQAQRKSMARMIIALADGKKEVREGGREEGGGGDSKNTCQESHQDDIMLTLF